MRTRPGQLRDRLLLDQALSLSVGPLQVLDLEPARNKPALRSSVARSALRAADPVPGGNHERAPGGS